MNEWIRRAKTETRALRALTVRLDRFREQEGAAPRWYLFRETQVRTARAHRLVEALGTRGYDEVEMGISPFDALERAEEQGLRFARDREFQRELREHEDEFWRRPVLPQQLDEPSGQLLAHLWELEDQHDLRARFVGLDIAPPRAPLFRTDRWWEQIPHGCRPALERRLRNYRGAWLLTRSFQPSQDLAHRIFHLDVDTYMTEAQHQALDHLRALLNTPDGGALADEAVPLLIHLLEFTVDVGFDRMLDILHGPGVSSRVGQTRPHGVPYNLLPRDDSMPGKCCPTVVATARGTRGRFGQKQVMSDIARHLYECKGKTRLVLFLTDRFEEPRFAADHAQIWRAAHADGVRFAVFLAGDSIRGLSPVHLRL